jgi:hypothetical protein
MIIVDFLLIHFCVAHQCRLIDVTPFKEIHQYWSHINV